MRGTDATSMLLLFYLVFQINPRLDVEPAVFYNAVLSLDSWLLQVRPTSQTLVLYFPFEKRGVTSVSDSTRQGQMGFSYKQVHREYLYSLWHLTP